MEEYNEKQTEDETSSLTVKNAGEKAQVLLKETFTQLIQVDSLKTTADPDPKKTRLFFPNGIELISIKIEAGLSEKTKVVVDVKIAGEKGAKPTDFVSEQIEV